MSLESDQDRPLDEAEMLAEMRLLREALQKDTQSRSSWKLALRNGAIGAVGGLLASSILIGVAVHVLEPLNRVSQLKTVLERFANEDARKPNR